jgi:hypothetical protein
MKESHAPAVDRLEALKEMDVLRRESYKLTGWPVAYYYSGAHRIAGDKEYPVRLEAQVVHSALIQPLFDNDTIFKGAYILPIESNTSALNGPRLSYVLEIPEDNIIHMGNKAVERDLKAYVFTLYQNGIVRMAQQMRSHDIFTDTRRVGDEENVELLNTYNMRKEDLEMALIKFLPTRSRHRHGGR